MRKNIRRNFGISFESNSQNLCALVEETLGGISEFPTEIPGEIHVGKAFSRDFCKKEFLKKKFTKNTAAILYGNLKENLEAFI